ncbi:hypothetical protein MMC16_005459 [Acarospora aff. strigata]|nr:hypothetical protein [Acarospora aff. strigata]
MSTIQSLPPAVHHSTRPVSPTTALSLLSTYIASAATDASLQPNALLTERGPISSTSGSSTGLTIHNLKRVEAGLRGEHLGADLSFAKFGGEGLPDLQVGVNGVVGGGDVEVNGEGGEGREGEGGGAGEDGWQDLRVYEREQEITDGEVGARDTGLGDSEGVPMVKESKSIHNKVSRKARKIERRKKERRDFSEKKAREKAAEI